MALQVTLYALYHDMNEPVASRYSLVHQHIHPRHPMESNLRADITTSEEMNQRLSRISSGILP